jgi:hypothetical protein
MVNFFGVKLFVTPLSGGVLTMAPPPPPTTMFGKGFSCTLVNGAWFGVVL